MTIVAQFYPNGEFSHGVDTSRARKERRHKECRHKPIDPECRDRYVQWFAKNPEAASHLCIPGQSYETPEGKLWVYTGESGGKHYYDCLDPEGTDVLNIQLDYPIGRLIGEGRLNPLVYQMVESSPQNPEAVQGHESSRKRLEGMTKHMARNIRQAAYLLDKLYGKDNISFLTLTLPNLSTDELGLCCERWDYMVDQFLKWLRKRSQKLNIEFQYVYCTEIQSKRLQQRNEYAPHLHIAFRGRYAKKHPWIVTPKQVRKAWASIISNVVGRRNFDDRSLENLQRVKQSVARYLSKYLSKGSCVLPQSDSGGFIGRLRTQWGGMARCLSRAIRRCTVRLSGTNDNGGLGVRIIRHMDELIQKKLVRYYKAGEIVLCTCSTTGVERVLKVGVGCLAFPTFEGGLSKVGAFLQGMEGGREVDDSLPDIFRPTRGLEHCVLRNVTNA